MHIQDEDAVARMLPEFYERSSDIGSPIVNAILAISLAYLSHVESYPGCEVMARTEYCEAINKINGHLQRQIQVPINELLTAISLMGFFESLMPSFAVEDLGPRDKWYPHLRGTIALVRMIEIQPLDTLDVDPNVLNIIYFQTVITCIRNRFRPPLSILTWNSQMDGPSSKHPGASILYMMNQVACWQVDMDTAMANSSVDPHQAEAQIVEMLATLQQADVRVLQWESNLPFYLVFHVRDCKDEGDEYPLSRSHDLLSLPGAPRKLYTFRTCWAAAPRMMAFVVRAVLHRNIVKCCTWLAQRLPQTENLLLQRDLSRSIIVDVIEHISSCVNSFLMDSFIIPYQVYPKQPHEYEHERGIGKSMRLLNLPWPLSVAMVALNDDHILQAVGHQRAQWLEDVLNHVHKQIGMCNCCWKLLIVKRWV
jgi:hypothetical protein